MSGYSAVGLINPKTGCNVGGVFRLAFNYRASLVIVQGSRPKRYMKHPADVTKSYRTIPHILTEGDPFEVLPYDCVPVAVDLLEGAKDLRSYKHPHRACYFFGPEDGTLGKAITDRCAHKVFIPTRNCMNLASTVGIVLYDRFYKETLSHERDFAAELPALAERAIEARNEA